MSDMKHDAGKLRWSLLRGSMTRALEGVLSVLEFGAKKYKEDSWLTVPNAKRRYRDALDRHLAAIDKGEQVDEESGKPHLFHVACNALFLAELECREQPTEIPVDLTNTLIRGGSTFAYLKWIAAVRCFLEGKVGFVYITYRTNRPTEYAHVSRVLDHPGSFLAGSISVKYEG